MLHDSHINSMGSIGERKREREHRLAWPRRDYRRILAELRFIYIPLETPSKNNYHNGLDSSDSRNVSVLLKIRSPAKETEPFFFFEACVHRRCIYFTLYDFVRRIALSLLFFSSSRQNAFTPPSSSSSSSSTPRNVCLRPRRESLVIQIYLSLPII